MIHLLTCIQTRGSLPCCVNPAVCPGGQGKRPFLCLSLGLVVIRNRNPSREKREVHCNDTKVCPHGISGNGQETKGGATRISLFLLPWVFLCPSLQDQIPFLSLVLSLILSAIYQWCNGSPNIQSFFFQEYLGILSFLLSRHMIQLRSPCPKLGMQLVTMLCPVISTDSLWSQK